MNKTNKRYAFFLDIDGTLYTRGVVPMKNRQAIRRARQAGHLVFINTARSYCNLPPKVKKLAVDGFICSLGCCIMIGGKREFCVSMPPETLVWVFDCLNENGDLFVFEGEDQLLCNAAFLQKHPDEAVTVVKNSGELQTKYAYQPVAKVFVSGQMSAAARAQIGARFTVFQHPNYAEFALDGFSKATGIDYVAEKYGIPLSTCVAMGDSINDLDMLRHCGISVAMGSGAREIREMCDMVTCNAAEGGVAQAILKITGLENPDQILTGSFQKEE